MAGITGQGTTFNLPNFVGELFGLTPTETPFLSMIGGLTGGRGTDSVEFGFTTYDLPAPSQPAILEGAVAPDAAERVRAQVTNVVQIFQYGIEVSYTKLAATQQLNSSGHAAGSMGGSNTVTDELNWQTQRTLEQAARDVNYTFINGVYARPATNATARKTRGMVAAITTNAVAAGALALSKTHIDSLLLSMWQNGAPIGPNTVIFANGFQKQALSHIYGYAPMDRNIGGVNIKQIETDFGLLGVVLDRAMPTDTLGVFDLGVCVPRLLNIPGKGFLFREPLAKTGASEKHQVYGECGLEYGPENFHGKITGLATS